MLLDTNVISEVMRSSPEPSVIGWMNAQSAEQLFTSTVTIGEIHYGLALLPDGERRRDLERRFGRFIAQGFSDRVLDFDVDAARVYGSLMADRRRTGRPMSALDGQIAAIARVNDLDLITRNERDFDDCGIGVVNPFPS